MPGRRLQIIDEGLAAVDQLQPTAVVKDALFQNGGGAPQLAGPSVELLGQIHLVTIRSRQTEQGIRLLLQRGLSLEQGAELARKALGELDGLRLKLQSRLEQELQQMEQWWQGGEKQQPTLRLEAQKLADQLAAIDELKGQLEQLLKQRPDSE